jgi:putative nucleotidyltransferase with HDIG domain
MKQEDLLALKNWFTGYCDSFSAPIREDQQNIMVKRLHTQAVCENAMQIGRDLNLKGEDLLLAESIALLHDVGRFPQYDRYKTFNDSISVNHAALGAQVLLEQGVLRALTEQERNLIVHAVTLHNVYSVPASLDDRLLLFVKLTRDADKLDIWRIFVEYFIQDGSERATAVVLGLPDTPAYSTGILACLARGELANKLDLRTLNDFKLLQLTWLYDLNFAASLRMVREREYIDKIAGMLPDVHEIKEAVDFGRAYLNRMLEGR